MSLIYQTATCRTDFEKEYYSVQPCNLPCSSSLFPVLLRSQASLPLQPQPTAPPKGGARIVSLMPVCKQHLCKCDQVLSWLFFPGLASLTTIVLTGKTPVSPTGDGPKGVAKPDSMTRGRGEGEGRVRSNLPNCTLRFWGSETLLVLYLCPIEVKHQLLV